MSCFSSDSITGGNKDKLQNKIQGGAEGDSWFRGNISKIIKEFREGDNNSERRKKRVKVAWPVGFKRCLWIHGI